MGFFDYDRSNNMAFFVDCSVVLSWVLLICRSAASVLRGLSMYYHTHKLRIRWFLREYSVSILTSFVWIFFFRSLLKFLNVSCFVGKYGHYSNLFIRLLMKRDLASVQVPRQKWTPKLWFDIKIMLQIFSCSIVPRARFIQHKQCTEPLETFVFVLAHEQPCSLLMCQDKDENETENDSFHSF